MVLRNRYRIKNDEALQKVERFLTELAAYSIKRRRPPYDLRYLRIIHEHLFQQIYEWAGQIRTVDISKNRTRFCNCRRIEPEANKLFQGLAEADYYTNDSRDELVVNVSELYVEINMVHPFREGNGRAQRILFDHIVVNCDYELSLESVTEDEWTEANIAGAYGDNKPMEKIFDRCIGAIIV